MKVLSVVCARAGSKGLKDKCLRKIGSKSVIDYSIEYSLSLGETVKTVVSTDIKAVIDRCRKNDIDCIYRCPELCEDNSRIDGALADAIEKFGRGLEFCSLVYGNVPTRYPALFKDAASFLERNIDYDAVISMQNVGKYHPDWMYDFNEEILPPKIMRHYRRQMLPKKMIHDGHTLIFNSDKFLKKYQEHIPYNKKHAYGIFGDRIKPLLNDEVIIDIDNEKDLRLAQAVMLSPATI